MSVCEYMHMCADACCSQRMFDSLELAVQVVGSCLTLMLGTELGSSERAAIALNH